jgi:hypothetical protein
MDSFLYVFICIRECVCVCIYIYIYIYISYFLFCVRLCTGPVKLKLITEALFSVFLPSHLIAWWKRRSCALKVCSPAEAVRLVVAELLAFETVLCGLWVVLISKTILWSSLLYYIYFFTFMLKITTEGTSSLFYIFPWLTFVPQSIKFHELLSFHLIL